MLNVKETWTRFSKIKSVPELKMKADIGRCEVLWHDIVAETVVVITFLQSCKNHLGYFMRER